ncbi:MAG: GH3 auxin-responsive promoter family protein [Myxococcota bacterium]
MPFPPAGNGPYRLLRAFHGRAIGALARGCDAARATQAERLAVVLAGARGTAFAGEHGLAGDETLESLREKVPIRTHAEHLPWLDRVAAGEPDVLTRHAVRQLLETSGTTGRPKWLPVTDPWARSVADAQQLWVLALLRDDEGLAEGSALSVVSPAETSRSPGGLAIGSNTGRMFLAQPWWVRWRAPVPYAAYCVEDPDVRAYCVLRHALAQPVRSWTTANPSTILLYCRRARAWWEDLRADCADGTLSRGPAASLSPADRKRTGAGKKARLGEDASLAKHWALRRVNCWTGGSAPFFLGRLADALGADVPVREVGITASEGYFAVPIDDGAPVAWLAGHVLEFVDGAGEPRWAWELREGEEYRLVVTTEAGLWRYDLGDVVRCVGWLGEAPRLVFVRKAGNVLDATGEKVTEDQVVLAAKEAFPTAAGISTSLGWGEVPAIRIAVEGEGDAAAFDAALRRLNVEYEGKRRTERLGSPVMTVVPAGTFAAWRMARVRAGAPDAQVKDPVVLDPERWEALVRG